MELVEILMQVVLRLLTSEGLRRGFGRCRWIIGHCVCVFGHSQFSKINRHTRQHSQKLVGSASACGGVSLWQLLQPQLWHVSQMHAMQLYILYEMERGEGEAQFNNKIEKKSLNKSSGYLEEMNRYKWSCC